MEVAAALLDASRRLSEENKDNFKNGSSTGNMSMGSSSSFSSGNETGATASSNTASSSWLSNPWAGERKRTMSDCVSSTEKVSTLAWLGGWAMTSANTGRPGGGGQGKEVRRPDNADKRRASCKGVESAMAGSLGKVWYDS